MPAWSGILAHQSVNGSIKIGGILFHLCNFPEFDITLVIIGLRIFVRLKIYLFPTRSIPLILEHLIHIYKAFSPYFGKTCVNFAAGVLAKARFGWALFRVPSERTPDA